MTRMFARRLAAAACERAGRYTPERLAERTLAVYEELTSAPEAAAA